MEGLYLDCLINFIFFFFNVTATTEIYTLSLHDALPILSSNAQTTALCTTGDCLVLGVLAPRRRIVRRRFPDGFLRKSDQATAAPLTFRCRVLRQPTQRAGNHEARLRARFRWLQRLDQGRSDSPVIGTKRTGSNSS